LRTGIGNGITVCGVSEVAITVLWLTNIPPDLSSFFRNQSNRITHTSFWCGFFAPRRKDDVLPDWLMLWFGLPL